MSDAVAGRTAAIDDSLSFGLKLGWAAGSLGTVTILSTTSFLLLFFMTTLLGMGPALAGGLLFGAKLFDALIAPWLGRVSDGHSGRWGRRRPFLLLGAFASLAAFLILFNPPALAGTGLNIWMVGGLLVMAAGYTLFNVPYIAMPAEMTGSPQERTALMSYRIAFVGLGGALVGFAPKFAAELGGDRVAYAWVGAGLGMVVFVAMLVAFLASRNARATTGTPGIAMGSYAVIFANRPFMLLLAAKALQLVGLAAIQASVLFFLKQVLGIGEGTIGGFVGVTTVLMLLSMPFWVWAAKRWSKRFLFMAGCLAYALVQLSWLLAVPGEALAPVMLRAAAGGFFTGGILLMGQSILPDAIDHDCRRTGVRREGLYAGAYSFVEKASTALGPLLVGLILAAAGFDPKAAAAGIAQGADAITGVYLGAAVLPALLYALSVVPLWYYRLDADAREGKA